MFRDIPSFPISQFCRTVPDTLTAEASTLGFNAGQPPYCQLYDDSCDIGIRIEGKKSLVNKNKRSDKTC